MGYGVSPFDADHDDEEETLPDEGFEPRRSGYCEDFPCCGHEAGDCNGGLYGSDESIKAAEWRRIERAMEFGEEY